MSAARPIVAVDGESPLPRHRVAHAIERFHRLDSGSPLGTSRFDERPRRRLGHPRQRHELLDQRRGKSSDDSRTGRRANRRPGVRRRSGDGHRRRGVAALGGRRLDRRGRSPGDDAGRLVASSWTSTVSPRPTRRDPAAGSPGNPRIRRGPAASARGGSAFPRSIPLPSGRATTSLGNTSHGCSFGSAPPERRRRRRLFRPARRPAKHG